MANRFIFGAFIATGMLSLAACTTVQTASERQTYFENASTAKLAWQPALNVPTSFQGCEWGGESYPCQPYNRLTLSHQNTDTSLKSEPSANTSYKKVHDKKKASHVKALPLCQPSMEVNAQAIPVENNSVLVNKTNT